MNRKENSKDSLEGIRSFYNSVYYKSAHAPVKVSSHLQRLAKKIGVSEQTQVLDVACGTGEWLLACQGLGAAVNGVDLSEKAISLCQSTLQGEFYATPAEQLPFDTGRFDIVTCLGSLEHFVEPDNALAEMVRVGKDDAVFLKLVPNADFLTRKLGLYAGTQQVDAKEEVRTLPAWQRLFNDAGLEIVDKWRDLHVLSWSWISSAGLLAAPVRALQAVALVFWPLRWQYQVYHICKKGDFGSC